MARLRWRGQKGVRELRAALSSVDYNNNSESKRVTPQGKPAAPAAKHFCPRILKALTACDVQDADTKSAGKRLLPEGDRRAVPEMGEGAFKRFCPALGQ